MLQQAEVDYERAGFGLNVAACRYHRGKLLGGKGGEVLVAEAVEWMKSRDIERPDLAMYLISIDADKKDTPRVL